MKSKIRVLAPTFTPWQSTKPIEKQIIVMMSGGVDSSVTALLLKDAGWDVLGITMKIPVAKRCDVQRSCCGMEAGYVCKDLGITHYYVDVQDTFNELVIEPFRKMYYEGRTPSPCVDCNTYIKFGVVWDALIEHFGISNLATGHYAKVIRTDNGTYLARGTDKSRDQSYFLYGIVKEKLPFLYLPLEAFSKDEVRQIAKDAGLPVARKQDSMELCFAGEGDYRKALGETEISHGPILDTSGNILGKHSGIHNYTIGQRKGLGVSATDPLYVLKIIPAENTIVVGSMDDTKSYSICAEDINILIPEKMSVGSILRAKIRSQGDPTNCTIKSIDSNNICVNFDLPQFAPTPGQRLVLYDENDYVAAGGVITLNSL